MKAKKLILVTSEAHPMHKAFLNVLDQLTKELSVEKEVKIEDYSFLADYGEKDDLGMSWLPQLFLELEDGKIVPILTRMPLGADLKADPIKGKEEALNKIKSLTS